MKSQIFQKTQFRTKKKCSEATRIRQTKALEPQLDSEENLIGALEGNTYLNSNSNSNEEENAFFSCFIQSLITR